MKSLLKIAAVLLTSASLTAFADTVTFPVAGMHCDSCVKAVTSFVCDKVKSEVKSCDVKLLDSKTEKGQIVIEPLPGKSVDQEKIAALVKKSGYTAGAPVVADASAPKK